MSTFGDRHDLSESMGAFESALVKKQVQIRLPELKRVLVAIDRSNQERTAVRLAAGLAKRLDARIGVIYANEQAGERELSYAKMIAGELCAAPLKCESEAIQTSGPLPSHQILAAQERFKADLIIAPAPYLRDVGLLGDESLGSVADMLMAETPVPLLFVRHPVDDVEALFQRSLLAMTVHVEEAELAAGWAFRLLDKGGEISVQAVADAALMGEAARLLGTSDAQDVLERAEMREVGPLVAAIQKYAVDHDLQAHVDVKVGNPVELAATAANDGGRLVFMGAPSDRTHVAYHRVQDILLRSKNPVLVT
ncbi:MAG: universal stress protein [Myxococcales bacterium]